MNSIISSQGLVAMAHAPIPGVWLENRVSAGFPSPAEELGAQRVDLAHMLVVHAQATYFLRASGQSMVGVGIFDNDILVVDRAIQPRHKHIVVAIVDGDFTVKTLHRQAGRIWLQAANPVYPDIVPRDGQTIEVWGVVTSSIKQFAV